MIVGLAGNKISMIYDYVSHLMPLPYEVEYFRKPVVDFIDLNFGRDAYLTVKGLHIPQEVLLNKIVKGLQDQVVPDILIRLLDSRIEDRKNYLVLDVSTPKESTFILSKGGIVIGQGELPSIPVTYSVKKKEDLQGISVKT